MFGASAAEALVLAGASSVMVGALAVVAGAPSAVVEPLVLRRSRSGRKQVAGERLRRWEFAGQVTRVQSRVLMLYRGLFDHLPKLRAVLAG